MAAIGGEWLPGVKFEPTDEVLVLHYLLPRIHGEPLPVPDAIIEDDPHTAAPWELLARHGRRDDAFFLAPSQATHRTGTWKCKKSTKNATVVGGKKVSWRKRVLHYQHDADKRSAGYVMHEFDLIGHDNTSPLLVCRVRKSERARKRERDDFLAAAAARLCRDAFGVSRNN